MTLTSYHAKYFANDLTRRATGGIDRLSMSLFDAAVDINPHQVEAALFALHSPVLQGVILADEVGLGKTIEAGIVLCQLWAERRRKLLILCPASIRKQWALELLEKFDLPAIVLDSRTEREFRRDPALHAYRPDLPMTLDEGILHFWPFAKYAVAFLRMSRSIFTHASSPEDG